MDIPLITTSLLTNSAYGYPTRGTARRIKPLLLACIHITGNSTNLGDQAAQNEATYANRTGSNGPSAHYYLNRDGSGIQAIDPVKYAAWSNGAINTPRSFLGYSVVRDVYTDNSYNPNEAFLLEIENVGYGSTYPITDQQKNTIAYLLATYSISQEIPITRDTVFAHNDLDSVNKVNCPAPKGTATEALLSDIITRAVALRTQLIQQSVQAQVDALNLQLAALTQRNTDLITNNNELVLTLADVKQSLSDTQNALGNLQTKYDSLSSLYDQDQLLVEEYNAVKDAWKIVTDKLSS